MYAGTGCRMSQTRYEKLTMATAIGPFLARAHDVARRIRAGVFIVFSSVGRVAVGGRLASDNLLLSELRKPYHSAQVGTIIERPPECCEDDAFVC